MLQKLINFLRGNVRLEVAGAFPERFLNLCAQRGVLFWNVEWLDSNCLRLTVTRQGGRQVDALAEKVMCTVTPAKRAGVPFFLGRFRKRYALLVGLALALTAVCVLSRFVLTVDVEGNEKVPTAEILSELRRQGLRVGAYGPGLDGMSISHEALLQLPELSWMAINFHGTRAEVLVREAIPKPELVDDDQIGNVVAQAPGIITHMEVLAGEPVYKEGDTVVAGEVLITGNIKIKGPEYGGGVDLGWTQTRAAGRVYARTWRTLRAEIPMEAAVKEYTGEEKSFFSVTILGRRINFYGKSGISFPEYDKISSTRTVTLPNGREMPLAFRRETVRAYTTAAVPVDRAAAEQLLEQRLEEALQAALGEDGEALKLSFTTAERDGLLRVTLQAECKEEIGTFVPIAAAPAQPEADGEAPAEAP